MPTEKETGDNPFGGGFSMSFGGDSASTPITFGNSPGDSSAFTFGTAETPATPGGDGGASPALG